MHTLQEVVAFTGVAGTAGQMPGAGTRLVSLRSSGDLVTAALPAEQRLSLRALCAALPTLPPIALEARITEHGDDVAPTRPVIEVDVPSGAVVETVVNFFSGGVVQEPASSARRLVDGQEIDGTRFSSAVFAAPGLYEAVVRRVGVTGSGVVDLQRRLPFRVRAVPQPPPPPPPPVRAAGPSCGVELDNSNPGFGGISNVRVFGSGFVPGEELVALEDGGPGATTRADRLGFYSVTIGVLEANVPVTHRFQAISPTTGAKSNEAGFTV